jgi:hypothetical protein
LAITTHQPSKAEAGLPGTSPSCWPQRVEVGQSVDQTVRRSGIALLDDPLVGDEGAGGAISSS